MMGAGKTHHGLAVLLCLILMFFQFSLVSSVDGTTANQLQSSTTDGPAATDSTTTPLPTDLPTMTTTTTTTTSTPPPETITPTTSSEPNPPTSTLDGTSSAAGPSTTTGTSTSETTTTGQPASVEPKTSSIAPTPTTSPPTTSLSSGSTTPPASSGVTSLPSSPSAELHSTAESAGQGTTAVSSTTVSTESTASPEGSGSATSTSESSVIVLTSTPPSPTMTSTATVTVTTTTTTTAAATTTTAKHAYPTKKPEKPFRLAFEVGDSNASTVYCTDNCTFGTTVGHVQKAFSSVPGYLYVESGDGAANRRRRDTRFSVAVLFNQGVMVSLTAEDRAEAVYVGFKNLDSSSSVQVQIDQVNDTIVAGFVQHTTDMCKVPNTCPLGYRCGQGVCYHLCENYDCSSNGVCQAVVDTDGSSRATCVCNSGYEHTYSGAHCENEETSDAKKTAIVGGVLGTFCAIFLILILFLYCRLRESDGGSKRNYQLGGYSNNGYADQEFAMRNPASDDP